MRISRIKKIRDHRVFRDFTWPESLPAFGQYNLIYGWNGSGKTTLSSLLRHVQDRKNVDEGHVEIEIDDGPRIAGSAFTSSALPNVRVFNREFIEASVLASHAPLSPIYFLGQESVEKQREAERLQAELGDVNSEAASLAQAAKVASGELDQVHIKGAERVREALRSAEKDAFTNYDRRNFKQEIEALTQDTFANVVIGEDQKDVLREQINAKRKESLTALAVTFADLEASDVRVRALLRRVVASQVLAPLESDAKLAKWVQLGLELHSESHAISACRFCEQQLPVARLEALRAHFNDELKQLQGEIASLRSSLAEVLNITSSIPFPDSARFYEHLVHEYELARSLAHIEIAKVVECCKALLLALSAKEHAPFTALEADAYLNGVKAPKSGAVDATIAAINLAIEKHNNQTANFDEERRMARRQLAKSLVAEAFDGFTRALRGLEKAQAEEQRARDRAEELRGDIERIEREIKEHRRPAEELNAEIHAYLGRDELKLDVRETGYSISRGNLPATHLSEGERTAIAFLYFLKSLQDKSFAPLENGIVVIDDPVSSLDANALFSAFGHMKERTKSCGQLFILTHSFAFFRQVRNWFDYAGSRGPKPTRRMCQFYALQASTTAGLRTSALKPIDPLLTKFESEYQYIFKRVAEEARRTDEAIDLDGCYSMPNIARRLLETFLSFRFPDLSGELYRQLDSVNYSSEAKTRILRFVQTYSHGRIEEPEHDPTILMETRPVLQALMELIKTVDRAHYDGMMKLLERPEAPQS